MKWCTYLPTGEGGIDVKDKTKGPSSWIWNGTIIRLCANIDLIRLYGSRHDGTVGEMGVERREINGGLKVAKVLQPVGRILLLSGTRELPAVSSWQQLAV